MMKSLKFAFLGLAVAAIGTAVFARSPEMRMSPADADTMSAPAVRPASAQHAGTPVVLELFTSEGCSSCPPADSLLTDLTRSQSVSGVHLIPLAEHVDYWNSLGWTDRFSSHAYSARQSGYARQFGLDSVYTPQLVVDGHAQFVGSDRDAALQAINDAASRPKADVHVTAQTSGDTLSVTTNIQRLPKGAHDCDVMLAVTESGLSTHVGGGENGGRTLNHNGVVRDLESIGTVDSGGTLTKTTAVTLNPRWKRDQLQVVVFVQDRDTQRIYGADASGV